MEENRSWMIIILFCFFFLRQIVHEFFYVSSRSRRFDGLISEKMLIESYEKRMTTEETFSLQVSRIFLTGTCVYL